MAKVLITRPDYDDVTFYLSKWSNTIIKKAEAVGHRVVDLRSKRATRQTFESVVEGSKPRLILLNGHGSNDSVAGQAGEVILDKRNIKILKAKLVHAFSCSAAKELGQMAVDSGCEAFAGYTAPFLFIIDNNKSNTPLRDNVARPFFESANTLPLVLLKGRKMKDAVKEAKAAYSRWIIYYRTHTTLEGADVLPYLIWNLSILAYSGSDSASL